jgi:hypothetical protein
MQCPYEYELKVALHYLYLEELFLGHHVYDREVK